ncbi:uncharacterized protein JCM6883_000577 [Sporobolomyces salmoneus]|uniref:uncharacterized protein n=1 Tax=Sporobolomyces salmoneus TaxID=183962 RepID=UPI003182B4CE
MPRKKEARQSNRQPRKEMSEEEASTNLGVYDVQHPRYLVSSSSTPKDPHGLHIAVERLHEQALRNVKAASAQWELIRIEAGIHDSTASEVSNIVKRPENSRLRRCLRRLDEENEMLHSIEDLKKGVKEFSSMPGSISSDQIDACFESLFVISGELNAPLKQRELLPFPKGSRWDLVCRDFYDYSGQAIRQQIAYIQAALNQRYKQDKTWSSVENKWADLVLGSKRRFYRGARIIPFYSIADVSSGT